MTASHYDLSLHGPDQAVAHAVGKQPEDFVVKRQTMAGRKPVKPVAVHRKAKQGGLGKALALSYFAC